MWQSDTFPNEPQKRRLAEKSDEKTHKKTSELTKDCLVFFYVNNKFQVIPNKI